MNTMKMLNFKNILGGQLLSWALGGVAEEEVILSHLPV